MKIHFKELEENGFKRSGNWWIKGNISINLISNAILHSHNPSFTFDFDYTGNGVDLTLEDVLHFSDVMAKMTGYDKL